MRNKGYSGDFGALPRTNADFGNMGWSLNLDDLKKQAETFVNKGLKDFESQAGDWLKLQTQSLPPEVRAQLEAEIKKGGAKTVDQLKAMAQQKALEYAQAQAKAKASDPEFQNTAITSSVEAGAKQLSNNLVSLKTLLMNGQIGQAFKQHPILLGVPTALGSLIGLKLIIGTTRFVVGKKKAPAMANPFKKKKRFNRKFKIRKIK